MIQIDMEMPKSCRTCPMKKVSYGAWCVLHDGVPAHVTDFNKRPDWCPLLPANEEMSKPVMDGFMKETLDACEKEIQRRVKGYDD